MWTWNVEPVTRNVEPRNPGPGAGTWPRNLELGTSGLELEPRNLEHEKNGIGIEGAFVGVSRTGQNSAVSLSRGATAGGVGGNLWEFVGIGI
jgi:hypothetical protein